MTKNSNEWVGVVNLTREEEKFFDTEVEDIPVTHLTERGFISKLKKYKPAVIFVVHEPGCGAGSLSIWFIDKIKNRRVETLYLYECDGVLGWHFDEECTFGPLKGILTDIIENEDEYSQYRIRTLKDLDEYVWRISWGLVLEKE
jgi:hypothetical protein